MRALSQRVIVLFSAGQITRITQCTQVISRAAAADPCVRNVATDEWTRTTDSCNVRASLLLRARKARINVRQPSACKILAIVQSYINAALPHAVNVREAIPDQTSFDEPFRHMGRARFFPST